MSQHPIPPESWLVLAAFAGVNVLLVILFGPIWGCMTLAVMVAAVLLSLGLPRNVALSLIRVSVMFRPSLSK